MPELPEVEATRLSFAQAIAGAKVTSVRLGKPLRWPLGVPTQRLLGQAVVGVRRRGKYLLLDLSEGLLLLHLGMSGSLGFSAAAGAPGVHDHFDLVTSHGVLRLHDPRRFGAAVFADDENDPRAQKLLGRLGLEPLDPQFVSQDLRAALQGHKAAIKQVLLAGKVVVGVGNIYASEALFQAAIRPTTRANTLGPVRVRRLQQAIRDVLERALRSGGSTLRNYANARGEAGQFQLEVMVYGRAGEPCRQCGHPIRGLRQGQRSTFFCPVCQKS